MSRSTTLSVVLFVQLQVKSEILRISSFFAQNAKSLRAPRLADSVSAEIENKGDISREAIWNALY